MAGAVAAARRCAQGREEAGDCYGPFPGDDRRCEGQVGIEPAEIREYELYGFVEHVRPLDLTNETYMQADCLQCGAQILANRAEVRAAR